MVTDEQLTFIVNAFGICVFIFIFLFHFVTVQTNGSGEINEWTQIGIGLTLFGVLFIFLGVLMFFDKSFIAMGNLLFVLGIILIIGFTRTISFFTRKWKGGVCFAGGFILVMIGWPISGMLVELFGFINLFGDFFPTLLYFLVQIPIIGHFFVPIQKLLTGRRLPV